jgi:tRNA-specific 2-thiouridylase
MYVVGIVPQERAVVVGTGEELFGHRVELEGVRWLGEPLRAGDSCDVQVRYRAQPVAARVAAHGLRDGSRMGLELAAPVRAITPGQSGVLYDGQRLLGGGLIN